MHVGAAVDAKQVRPGGGSACRHHYRRWPSERLRFQCRDLTGFFKHLTQGDSRLLRRRLRRIDHHFRRLRSLVGIVYAGEAFDLTGAGLFVQALGIALFTDLDRLVA